MSNVLNTLGYAKFLERRNQFTMNYSEIPRTFDKDIYSTLKSRQKFKKVEEVIVDIEKVTEKKTDEVKEIIIKGTKPIQKEPEKKEPSKNLIDENEREFLFASKPERESDEIKSAHEATFQHETKEILQENKKRIVITEEALEDPKDKKSKKPK